jgi:Flp pilus assembly protein TadG
MRRNKQNQRGAALVEFAFVLPVFIILVFGIIQFGLALNRVQAYHAAAREGARVGSLESSSTGDINTAINDALVGFGVAPAVSISPGLCAGRPGAPITVEVTAPYTIQIPLLPDTTITLEGDGVFRCEG